MKRKIAAIFSFVLSFVMIFQVLASDSSDTFFTDTIETALKNNILETNRGYIFDEPVTREEYCELIYNLIYESLGTLELPDTDVKFADTQSSKVTDLAKLKIIYGRSETNFAPQDYLTREEAAVIIARTVDSVLPLPRHEMYFVFDDETEISDWAKNSIQTVCNMGVMKGTGDNKFSPKDSLSVKDAITMVVRIFEAYKANKNIGNALKISILMQEETVDITDKDDINVIVGILNSHSYTNPICKGLVTHSIDYNGDIYYLLESCGEIKYGDKQAKISDADLNTIKSIINKAQSQGGSLSASGSTFTDKMNSLMPDDKNYMFSPFSIKMALAMAANGAEGDTRSEILNTLGISDLESYNKSAKQSIATYSQSDLLKLDVANSIWINKDKTTQNFSDTYKALLSDFFGATSDVVNEKDAAEKINGWVNEKTHGKIPSIISGDNADFWAMLVNAVYFKARWQNEFYEAATAEDVFTSKDGIEKNIDFMNKTGWMSYSDVDGVRIVRLPYLTRESVFDENGSFAEMKVLEDVDISMYLMMSDNGFHAEETLNNADFSKSSYIALSVPKFEVEYDAEIRDILRTLGVDKAFLNTADFYNMFDHGTMSIDSIKHKTYMKVDEKGTEAAAVTSVGMAGSALPPEPCVVKYNKPFTFVIRDNTNGEILFIGEYAFAK